MSIRGCIYKNCDNYINLKDRAFNDHITLFTFPKNPERRQKWIEYGKAPANLPASMYFYCSDHFDKRFLAINNRRTVLVGEAVPHIFVDETIDETYDDENLNYYLYEMKDDGSASGELDIEEQQTHEQEVHVESTTSMLDEDQNNDNNLDLQLDVECTKETKTTDLNILKRKLNDDSITSEPKIVKTTKPPIEDSPQKSLLNKLSIKPSSLSVSIKRETTIRKIDTAPVVEFSPKEPETNADSLIDTKYVTTFIYKGEEYVQMPKDHYIKEKIDLVRKLQKMEGVVKTIKEQLNSLEFE